MAGYEVLWAGVDWWWIIPVVMIVLCFFMMRGRMGCMMCWPSLRNPTQTHMTDSSDSAQDILDKRYALGEIDEREYEEKKKVMGQIKTNKSLKGDEGL